MKCAHAGCPFDCAPLSNYCKEHQKRIITRPGRRVAIKLTGLRRQEIDETTKKILTRRARKVR